MGVLETPAKEAGHAHHHKSPGLCDHIGQDTMKNPTHGATQGPANHHRRTENAATAPGPDGKGGGQNFSDGQRQENEGRKLIVQRHLGKTVAEGEGFREKKTDGPRHQTAYGRLDVIRHINFSEPALHTVKTFDIQEPPCGQNQCKNRVGTQFQRVSEDKGMCFKKGTPPENEAENAIGHDRRDTGGNNDLGFKFGVPVEDLRGKQRPGQRRSENTPHTGSHAGRQHDPALPIRKLQFCGEE